MKSPIGQRWSGFFVHVSLQGAGGLYHLKGDLAISDLVIRFKIK